MSIAECEDNGLKKTSLVHGECVYESFGYILEKIKKKYKGLQGPGGVYYDIGSGVGKPVFAAALLHNFQRCTGIEFLESLYKTSLDVLQTWTSEAIPTLPPDKRSRVPEVRFVHGDATELLIWRDATFIYMNSTCFDDRMMESLAEKADMVRAGCWMVTISNPLPSKMWQMMEWETIPMSWGKATVYIHKKIE